MRVPVVKPPPGQFDCRGSRRGHLLTLWGPVVAYMAVIFGLSSVSSVPALPGGMSDKTAHALLYAGLGVLCVRALSGGQWLHMHAGAVVGSLILSTLYGLTDETHQLFVPGREFDLKDLAADAVGAGVAAALAWACCIIRRFSLVHRRHS
jgi:VanZ family protein